MNAPGDFYVEDGWCIACTAPEHAAPDLMDHSDTGAANYHCYFRRQPGTEAELDQAIEAVRAACCGVVRYRGSDPSIIHRLVNVGCADSCDRLPDSLDERIK